MKALDAHTKFTGGQEAEIIVVDWASEIPLRLSLESTILQKDPRIKIIRVRNESDWILTIAYNLAEFFTDPLSSYIAKFDCDTIVRPAFFKQHLPLQNGSFIAGNWRRAKDENELHLNGIFVARKSDFESVGGYDERIHHYGYDDDDLYERLLMHNSTRQDLHFDSVFHFHHSASKRTERQTRALYSPKLETYINQMMLDKLPRWNKDFEKTKWKIRGCSQNDLELVLTHKVKHNRDILGPVKMKKVIKKARKNIRLNDEN
jgi:hypothetical protein